MRTATCGPSCSRGTGKFFCAGLDLKAGTSSLGGSKKSNRKKGFDLRNAPPTVLHAVDTPTICALNGSAAGYGMDIALGCDVRVMSQRSEARRRLHRPRYRAGIRRHLDPAAPAGLGEGL